ncbi:MAG TPA: MarR family transcriptional regulator [Acidimicrobiales bacterium]
MGSEPDDLVAAARAVAFTARRLERSLGEMTLPQFRVLALVASSTERASRIAERAAVSRPSLTGLLDGLEARGWVRRVLVDGDRRGVLLEVTDDGRDALGNAERCMAAALDSLLTDPDGTDPDDGRRDVALRGLAALGAALRAHRIAAEAQVEAHAHAHAQANAEVDAR